MKKEVRVVEIKGESVLVAWDLDTTEKRGYLPVDAVQGEEAPFEVEASLLAESVPYGIPFAELIKLGITPKRVEAALHLAGIWTYEDLQKHDRVLIRIATDMLGRAVWAAAKTANSGGRK